MKEFSALSARIGYQFNDSKLLEQALTHRSFNIQNNERFEFLGDALINFIIAAELFSVCEVATEGELTRLRASLVKGDTLATLAQELELGKYLRLGEGELRSGGMQRLSTLADTLEAIIGAIYLDAGIEECRRCVLQWYGDRIPQTVGGIDVRDPKTALQEYLQARKQSLPIYKVISLEGKAHSQIFHIECQVPGLQLQAEGSGSSRRKAEQAAAQAILTKLQQ